MPQLKIDHYKTLSYPIYIISIAFTYKELLILPSTFLLFIGALNSKNCIYGNKINYSNKVIAAAYKICYNKNRTTVVNGE